MMDVSPPTPDLPQSFGYKMSWCAVNTNTHDSQEVANTLGLRDVRPATWSMGIKSVYSKSTYRNSVFLTPAIKEWVLAIGFVLGSEKAGRQWARLDDLSRRFGEAQFFSTHRVVDLHAWARSVDVTLQRACGYCGDQGEVFWDIGPRLLSEPDFGINAFPDEGDVMAVAEQWSITPTELDRLGLPPSLGLLGRL